MRGGGKRAEALPKRLEQVHQPLIEEPRVMGPDGGRIDAEQMRQQGQRARVQAGTQSSFWCHRVQGHSWDGQMRAK